MISHEYRELNRQLHENPDIKYGYKGWQQAEKIAALVAEFEAKSVLDYGAGKQTLSEQLRGLGFTEVADYDPSIPSISSPPSPADIVVCSDVMEHVEPIHVSEVLDDLHQLTRMALFLRVCTVPCTSKSLPDGSNPHRSILPKLGWWGLLKTRFWFHREVIDEPNYFTFVLTPRKCPQSLSTSCGPR